jgi:hypothetical protein
MNCNAVQSAYTIFRVGTRFFTKRFAQISASLIIVKSHSVKLKSPFRHIIGQILLGFFCTLLMMFAKKKRGKRHFLWVKDFDKV